MDLGELIVKALVLALTMIIRGLRYLSKALVDLLSWIINRVNAGGSTLGWPRIGGRP
ncbi:hypothetical protein ES703_125908 [subsurface metagenome]